MASTSSVGDPSGNPNIISGERVGLLKSLDANKYATKKTIAQGLLDVALLTANASQLKYVLQVGDKHEFYVLMLSLISISIVLQAVQAILCLFLGASLDLNNDDDHPNAESANHGVLYINIVLIAVNILISTFQQKEPVLSISSILLTNSTDLDC